MPDETREASCGSVDGHAVGSVGDADGIAPADQRLGDVALGHTDGIDEAACQVRRDAIEGDAATARRWAAGVGAGLEAEAAEIKGSK